MFGWEISGLSLHSLIPSKLNGCVIHHSVCGFAASWQYCLTLTCLLPRVMSLILCVSHVWMHLIPPSAPGGRYCYCHSHLTHGETEARGFKHLSDIIQLDLIPDTLAPGDMWQTFSPRIPRWKVIITPFPHFSPPASFLPDPVASKEPVGLWKEAVLLNLLWKLIRPFTLNL